MSLSTWLVAVGCRPVLPGCNGCCETLPCGFWVVTWLVADVLLSDWAEACKPINPVSNTLTTSIFPHKENLLLIALILTLLAYVIKRILTVLIDNFSIVVDKCLTGHVSERTICLWLNISLSIVSCLQLILGPGRQLFSLV